MNVVRPIVFESENSERKEARHRNYEMYRKRYDLSAACDSYRWKVC
jgi:hypothetical protein